MGEFRTRRIRGGGGGCEKEWGGKRSRSLRSEETESEEGRRWFGLAEGGLEKIQVSVFKGCRDAWRKAGREEACEE